MAADWETLFGSLSFCDCDHCRSIYSPAAYFVDLLQFLKKSLPNSQGYTPLEILVGSSDGKVTGRRPDLQYIKLSCENTNTPLPYVDLVNEILETYVAQGDRAAANDTGDSAPDELAANPQFTNEAAYDKLKAQVYPLTLPFDRSFEVVRTYLDHLGSSRYEVMKTFQKAGQPTDLSLACEYLKISDNEHRILTGTDFAGAALPSPPTLAQFYGYDATTSRSAQAQSLAQVPEFLRRTGITYPDLIELVKTRFINSDQAITLDVPADQDPCDLSNTTIKYLDRPLALEKIHRYIRLWKKLGWKIDELDRVISTLGATEIDNALLLKLAQVKRLEAELKNPLDQLRSFWGDIDTEGRDSLYTRLFQNKAVLKPVDPDFRLTYVADLASPPAVPFPSSLSGRISYDTIARQLRFIGMMTPDERDELLPPSAPSLPEPSFQLAVDNLFEMRRADSTGPNVLPPAVPTISTHVDTILAALRLRAIDLAALTATEVTDDALTLANLSKLYRFSVLAKALRRSIPDLISLKMLAGVDPFPAQDPAATVAFLQRVEKVFKSRFSVAQLNYLYRDIYDPTRGVGPIPANVDLLLTTLQEGLQKIASDTAFVPDPTGDLLRQRLAVILDGSLVDPAVSLIAGAAVYSAPLSSPPPGFPDATKPKISYDATAGQLRFTGPMSDADRTMLVGLSANPNYQTAIASLWQQPRDFITNNLALFLNSADAISQLINTASLTTADKFNYALAHLLDYLRAAQSRSLVKQSLTDNLKLESELVSLLIDRGQNSVAALIQAQSDASEPAITDFLALATLPPFGPPPLPSDPTINAAKAAYRLMHKVALLVNTFKMTSREVAYLAAYGGDFRGVDPADPTNSAKFVPFNLNALPLDPSGFKPGLFNQWERLRDLFELRDGLPSGSLGLVDVLGAGSLAEATSKLVSVTNWDSEQVSSLTGPGFNFTLADFQNEIGLIKLQACWILIKRLGVKAQQLFNWASSDPDHNQAQDVKNTVKAKYDDQTWLTVAKALNDKLRESQKTALIAYLLTRPELQQWGVTDSNGLFEYFLIDVDMSACMMTSRIVQANSTIQLFVRRCLMNLESQVSPSAIDSHEWEWRESYRVAEANIKVFTYPENWILEELRDDKTPFFKDLEKELLQNDVNADTVEQAFQHYLEKLDEVARLEISGMYWEREDESAPGKRDGIDTIHVFGRTLHTPHVYYYRRFVDKTLWTAWEKVQIDIEGDHLIPVVWNRRLHLFWPIFKEVAEKPSDDNRANNTEPPKHLQIQIAWSEYKNGKWSAKKTSADQKLSSERIIDLQGFFVNSYFDFVDRSGTSLTEDAELDRSLYVFKASFDDPLVRSDGIVIQCFHNAISTLLFPSDPPTKITLSGVQIGRFRVSGCRGTVRVSGFEFVEAGLLTPDQSEVSFMSFGEEGDPGSGDLTLVTDSKVNDPSARWDAILLAKTDIPTLSKTPSLYTILYPHQYPQYVLQAPFFYQDDLRTYFVTPETVRTLPHLLKTSSLAAPFYTPDLLVSSRVVGPGPGDPPIFEAAGPATGNRTLTRGSPASRSGGLATSLLVSEPASGGAMPTAFENSLRGAPSSGSLRTSTPNTAARAQSNLAFGGTAEAAAISWSQESSMMDLPLVIGKVFYPFLTTDFKFASFYHPHVCDFIKSLNRKGISGLLTLDNQGLIAEDTLAETVFQSDYSPTDHVERPYPTETVDFSYGGPYSIYNWELFFHIPLLIFTRLSQNQKLDDALSWAHRIFNPTQGSYDPTTGLLDPPSKRYWKVLPFHQNAESGRIQDLFLLLDYKGSDPTTLDRKGLVQKQIAQWKETPFNPHAIARLRLMAYQKTVVMKYIDCLIAKGDYLFNQDTMESVNEAIQMYVRALEIMGPRPERVPKRGTVQEFTYHDLASQLDDFSNALVVLENQFPFSNSPAASSSNGSSLSGSLGFEWNFYFCIPPNDQLLAYWDTIADRLFKIRHCMNIEGVVRELPLFQPPIDPALLVQAAAMGVDISSALGDINAATPHYRFTYMLQKALELCGEVRTLGAAMLSALEKKDSEALAALRASQETGLLEAVRLVKEKQIEEANHTYSALAKYQEVVQARFNYYSTREFMNTAETAQLGLVGTTLVIYELSSAEKLGEALAALVPNSKVAAPTSAGTTFGGSNLAAKIAALIEALKSQIEAIQTAGTLCGIVGGHQRRWDDWQHQKELASRELGQVQKQILAAQVRADIAQKELDNHDLQIANAQAVEEFLRGKYTNADLYDWMVSQTSAVFFQCYRMAYDVAKRAERAYRFERGVPDSAFIRFGYWDSLKKGLLSGERLYLDLKRMEMAYLDQNKREYEITKHISLALLNPLALIALKETGQCIVDLPEDLFDADYCHFNRKMKKVTLTIPCVAGPYTSINCTVTLLKSSIRWKSDLNTGSADPYTRDQTADDPRFLDDFSAIESIATSHAQNDGGLFELNFRDERYLPFEGRGVISQLRFQMPKENNTFDFETITDVIINLDYTARDGGEPLRQAARSAMMSQLPKDALRMFSLKHEFPNEWYRFLHPPDAAPSQIMTLSLAQERFPFQFRGRTLQIEQVELFFKWKDLWPAAIPPQVGTPLVDYAAGSPLALNLTAPGDAAAAPPALLQSDNAILNGLPRASIDFTSQMKDLGIWTLEATSAAVGQIAPSLRNTVTVGGATQNRLKPEVIEDVVLVVHYSPA